MTCLPSISLMSKYFIILTGKRKSGKDFISVELSNYFNCNSIVNSTIHLSSFIKEVYAKEHNLNYDELISSGPYKEQYRFEMVKWGEEQRNKDPGIFCRHALSTLDPDKDELAVIVVAARRESDINYFINNFGRDKVLIVKILASESVRVDRGWIYTEGIDDRDTEIGLDEWNDWDFVLMNDTFDDGQFIIKTITESIKQKSS